LAPFSSEVTFTNTIKWKSRGDVQQKNIDWFIK